MDLSTVPGTKTLLNPRVFRDATGKRIALSSTPRRIVTLTPALAEQVFDLGLGHLVVGVTIRSERPPPALRKPCVGNLHFPDLDKISALQPDLILASQELNRRKTIEDLRARGVQVFVVPPFSSCANVLAAFRTLGRMLGRSEKARRLALGVTRCLRKAGPGRHPRVFLQVWTAPLLGVARESYMHDLIERCGGKNILTKRAGRVVPCSEREVVRANPQLILITLQRAAREVRRWRRYPQLAAVRQGRIQAIPASWVIPSPMALARGARELRKLFHNKPR